MSPRFRLRIRSSSRRAFTLVELLIAMAIFVILATLAIGGFRVAYDADRVGEAATVVRGGIEGARSRAIKSKEVRGLRLLLDPQDNRIVTSIVYVGEPEVIEGYCRVEFDNAQDHGDTQSHYKWRVFPAFDKEGNRPDVSWRQLFERGLLRAQCSIEIEGRPHRVWYRSTVGGKDVYGANEDPYTDDAWTLTSGDHEEISLFSSEEPQVPGELPDYGIPDTRRPPAGYRDTDEIGNSPSPLGLPSAVASKRLKYRLHLLPAVLEGASPVALPRNTCIDLDGSYLPKSWRPESVDRAYGPVAGNEVRPIDILFTPRGNVSRDLVGSGFLIFRIAHRNDVDAARINLGLNTSSKPMVIANPEYSARFVTLATQTGMIHISPVKGELAGEEFDGKKNNRYFWDTISKTSSTDPFHNVDPFRDAILGREAVQ